MGKYIRMSKELKDYIQVFENVVSDSLCDRILEEYSGSLEWKDTAVSIDAVIDKKIRSATSISISTNDCINKNPDARKKLDKEIFNCAGDVISRYNKIFYSAEIQRDSGYDLLRYEQDQFYREHIDSYIGEVRHVSCSFALNDDYEGGEWGFWNRELILKVPKGAAILFPSNFMYPHEILPVTKGLRYSIVTWFS